MTQQGTFWAYNLRPPDSERQRQANVHCSNIEIAKTWKQPKCSTEEWIKKMWYIYTMEYYSAIEKNEIMPFAATCLDMEIIIVSQTKTNIMILVIGRI